MEIKKEHKELLKEIGLKEDDFKLFDDKFLRYEFDEKMGVRIYDPYYQTSYDEYIGIDGWSAWSEEKDTFMSDILKGVGAKVGKKAGIADKSDQKKITEALQQKFKKKANTDS